MSKFNPIKLYLLALKFQLLVRINLLRCKTPFASGVHTTLLGKLDAITAELWQEIPIWLRLRIGRHFSDEIQADYVWRYFLSSPFESRWVDHGEISILDEIEFSPLDEDGREGCRAFYSYTEVPAYELEGLADILTAIERETGIAFVAARVKGDKTGPTDDPQVWLDPYGWVGPNTD